jgi:sterol desaturase/sphingolipid hydroxylase (fatty acid hydroxylase superfamily)/HEAT repeat protein
VLETLSWTALNLGAFALIFVPLEAAYGVVPGRGLRRAFVTDLAFFLGQYLLFSALALRVLTWVEPWVATLRPALVARSVPSWPLWAQAGLALVSAELVVYWLHRAFHSVGWLWRFHAVHHSAEHLDWMAAHREHPVDGLLVQLFMNLPAFWLGVSLPALAPLIVFRGIWAVLIHSNTRLPLGPLGFLLGAPEIHHWHHRKAATSHNFANLAPWVDWLFGTYYRPRPEERWELGLVESHPRGYLAQLIGPLLPSRGLTQRWARAALGLAALFCVAGGQRADAAEPCASVETCLARMEERCTQVGRPFEDAEVRAIAQALAKLGEPSVEPLRARLRTGRPALGAAAARALGELGPVARPAVPELLEALEQGVVGAAWALAQIGDGRAVQALQTALLHGGGGPSALGLTRLGKPGFEALAGVLHDPSVSEPVAQNLLEAFREGGNGIEASVPLLRATLEDRDRPTFARAYAAACLGELGPRALEAAPSLRELLKEASPLLQQTALDALAELGDRTVAPLLLERARSPEWSTRLAAFTGLAHLGPSARAVVPELVTELGSPDFAQRALAAEALGWIRDPRALVPLTTVLTGNSWSAAELSAEALGRLGARGVLPKLREAAAHHWSRRVRDAASAAVAMLQAAPSPASAHHDFRGVESARRIRSALSDRVACVGSEQGWVLRRDGRSLAIPAVPASEDVSKLLPTVLPPVRLGRDDGFHERTLGRSVPDGWLVSRDAGEWGGVLWFVGWDGKKKKLADQALVGFAEPHSGLLGLGSLPHHSRSAGALFKLVHAGPNEWQAEPLAELPGEPLAWQVLAGGAVVVVTPAGGLELGSDGRLRELACAGAPGGGSAQAKSSAQ